MICFDLLTKFDFGVMKLRTFTYMYFYFITESDVFKFFLPLAIKLRTYFISPKVINNSIAQRVVSEVFVTF